MLKATFKKMNKNTYLSIVVRGKDNFPTRYTVAQCCEVLQVVVEEAK